MSLHDQVPVAGVTEACKYNDHSMCNNPACGCDCHRKAVSTSNPSDNGDQPPPLEKACPKCGTKRPAFEVYCRIDGTLLASLLCNLCGAGMNPEDSFCYHCGAPKGRVKEAGTVPHIPVTVAKEVPAAGMEAADRVLRSIQEELSHVQIPTGSGGQAQVVVEQPAGAQGSFKLVSAPNPNKVRPAVSKPAIRLPIKPS